MQSKIEQIIDEIEDYISNCKYQTLSSTRIIVNKEEIDSLLAELKKSTPEEIKHYQRMLVNRDAILDDAKKKAEALINQATEQTTQLVNEHEIMQQAYAKANDIVQQATNHAQDVLDRATLEANAIRSAAMKYTDDLLANVEKIITRTTQLATSNYNDLLSNLNSCNGIVKGNRSELNPSASSDDSASDDEVNTDN